MGTCEKEAAAYAAAGSSDLAAAALRFRLRAHKPSRPVAKSGNVPGSGTAVTTGVPPGTTEIRVSGPVPKENVALVIVVAAVTPERPRVNIAAPSTKGLNMPFVMEALAAG